MKTEQIEKILNEAPEGATHNYAGDYWMIGQSRIPYYWDCDRLEWIYLDNHIDDTEFIRLKDLREILELRREVERLRSPWISADERLPEINDNYLCWVRDSGDYGYTEPSEYQTVGKYSKQHKRFFIVSGRYSSTVVTHWMPLPEPPKGEL